MAEVVLHEAGFAELLAPEGAAGRDLLRRGLNVEARAVELCPVEDGRLRGSITHEDVERTGEALVIRIGTNVDYALGIEEGTGLYGPKHEVIRPKTAKALRFEIDGEVVFVKSVKGRPATPFLRPALPAGAE